MGKPRAIQGVFTRPFALLRLVSLTAWIALLLWLSLDPSPPMPSNGFFALDKLLHAASYFTLIILTYWACADQSGVPRGFFFVRFGVAAILFGGLLEIAQGVLTTTRSAEFGDFLANGIGVGAALCSLQFRYSCLKLTAAKGERKAPFPVTTDGDSK